MIEGYSIRTGTKNMDCNEIHKHLTVAYWSEGITKDTVKSAVENSLCFGVFFNNEQVGFARAVTDFTTFAYVADVYIVEAHRGKGLSQWLMKTVFESPKLQGLRRLMLATRDAHGLYAKFGFKVLDDSSLFMERWNPNVYKNTVQ